MTEVDKQKALRSTQIIAAALIFGVVVFHAVVGWIVANRDIESVGEPGLTPILAYFALGTTVLALMLYRVVGRSATVPSADRTEQVIASGFATRTILRYAVLEGAALFNGVAFLFNGSVLSLAATVILLAVMAWEFPTAARYDRFAKPNAERFD